ncbi:hypothetical protein NVV95_08800 [Herbiconiux sp. CPCC 205716]|uniref:Septum formation-related domain-containing protein n=1 Tax=Herbiconiux gentiana TaxID=2970912 RepID=A0ABT2GEM1_9MICO|nr:hypothetical protein [Herbiconiux gentiana]MCS5714650.1 hypothetical protein [Herbiconiux gentiana]
MSLNRLVSPASAVALLAAVIVLTGCTSTAGPSSSATASPSATALPTATAAVPTATVTPTPTSSPTSAPTSASTSDPAAPASYDLDAVYAACVEATAEIGGIPGEAVGYDPADVQPASENVYLKDRFADDPTALAFYFTFDPDSDDLADTVPVLCSVSGPFDAPVVEHVRSLT